MTDESYGGLPAPGTIDGYDPWIQPTANGTETSDACVAGAENAPGVDFAVGRDPERARWRARENTALGLLTQCISVDTFKCVRGPSHTIGTEKAGQGS